MFDVFKPAVPKLFEV